MPGYRPSGPGQGVNGQGPAYGPNSSLADFGRKESSVDPRLTNEERLDQRYGNYTYGDSPDYGQQRADELAAAGGTAQHAFEGMGQAASNRGTDIYNRQTPTTDYSSAMSALGGANQSLGGASQAAGNQGDLYNRLTSFAEQGPGPSQAQAQLDASTGKGMRQQLALASSGRGPGGGASAMRQAMANQANIQGEANAAASVLRAQEAAAARQQQLQAYGMGSEVLSQQGNLGLGIAGQQAAMAEQYAGQSQFQTQAEIEAQAQRDQASMGYSQLGLDAQTQGYATDLGYEQEGRANLENQLDAGMGYEENLTNISAGQQSLNNAREQREQDREGQWIGGAFGLADGLIGLASDERGKKNIRDDDLSSRYADLNDVEQTDESFARMKSAREERENKREQEDRSASGAASKLVGGFGRGFASSDEHSKERVRELEDLNERYAALFDGAQGQGALSGDELAAAHAPAQSTTYEYKNPSAPGAGPGRYSGPMAQDLEGIPGVVQNTPQGKMVDTPRLSLATASAVGSQERRLRVLEAAKRGRSQGAMTDQERNSYAEALR